MVAMSGMAAACPVSSKARSMLAKSTPAVGAAGLQRPQPAEAHWRVLILTWRQMHCQSCHRWQLWKHLLECMWTFSVLCREIWPGGGNCCVV
jgi:hypothetical protein